MIGARLCVAVALLGFASSVGTPGTARAQSNSTVAAEQSCIEASQQGNNAAAVTACAQVMAVDPNNTIAAPVLCGAYTALANYNAAVTSCTQALKLNPEAEGAYVDRCNAYSNLGNFSGALADCQQAIALNPKDATPYVNLGNTYVKQNNYAGGVAEYNQAIAIDPNSAMALADRGLANAALGNKAAALADFQAALKIDPSSPPALAGMKLLGVAPGTGSAAASVPAPAPASGSDISVCNGFSVRIYVALAFPTTQGNFTAAGWWSVDPNQCTAPDFAFQGATLYYAADSDNFSQGGKTVQEHWGGTTNLYVSSLKFNYTNAQTDRSGAHGEMFSSVQLKPQLQTVPVTITFRFVPGNTDIDIEAKK
jgi:tetratricopeptide (TPR) repeat protein